MADTPGPDLPLDKFYEFTCRHIEREENIIDHRISWMLTSQGFLFTGFALISNGNATANAQLQSALSGVIEVVGIAIALLSLVGIHAAYLSVSNLIRNWENRWTKVSSGDKQPYSRYPAFTTRTASALGRFLGYCLPLVLMAAWLALIVRAL